MNSDVINDFIAHMASHGIAPVEPIGMRLMSGALIRFRCEGDGPGRDNGWAILYLDERPAGAFGNYRLNTGTLKWKADRSRDMAPGERARLIEEWNRAKARREAERRRSEDAAALEAADIWQAASPADPSHPYVERKELDVSPLRQSGDRLLIPMFDHRAMLRNLQRIAPDGSKRFIKGGATDGLFVTIGEFTRRGETCCIGEGYSTMAAVHRASGHPCIAAFSASNLLAVARLWNEHRPDLNFVLCADDDAHLLDHPTVKRNVGVEAARIAAEAIGARLAVPKGEAA